MFLNFEHLLFLFLIKMMGFQGLNHKMLVGIANREDPNQTASKSSLIRVSPVCLGPFWQATSVQNFRAFTVNIVSS